MFNLSFLSIDTHRENKRSSFSDNRKPNNVQLRMTSDWLSYHIVLGSFPLSVWREQHLGWKSQIASGKGRQFSLFRNRGGWRANRGNKSKGVLPIYFQCFMSDEEYEFDQLQAQLMILGIIEWENLPQINTFIKLFIADQLRMCFA